MKISAVVFFNPDQRLLKSALESASFADEVVFVNKNGVTETQNFAEKLGCRSVTPTKIYEYVEPVREWGVAQAKNDWVLVLDGDEEVPKSLADKLRAMDISQAKVWYLPRKNVILNHWMEYAGLWPDYQPRFYEKGSLIWAPIIHQPPEIKAAAKYLEPITDNALLHHNYSTAEEYINRLNQYSNIEASHTPSAEKQPSIFFYEDFLRRMLEQEGYKDGPVGSFVAISQAYYQLAAEMKRRETTSKVEGLGEQELQNIEKFEHELVYWLMTTKITRSKTAAAKLYWKIRRKMSI